MKSMYIQKNKSNDVTKKINEIPYPFKEWSDIASANKTNQRWSEKMYKFISKNISFLGEVKNNTVKSNQENKSFISSFTPDKKLTNSMPNTKTNKSYYHYNY